MTTANKIETLKTLIAIRGTNPDVMAALTVDGLTIGDLRGLELGSYYPILANDMSGVVGFFSAEFGTPAGYQLNETLQAFIEAEE